MAIGKATLITHCVKPIQISEDEYYLPVGKEVCMTTTEMYDNHYDELTNEARNVIETESPIGILGEFNSVQEFNEFVHDM